MHMAATDDHEDLAYWTDILLPRLTSVHRRHAISTRSTRILEAYQRQAMSPDTRRSKRRVCILVIVFRWSEYASATINSGSQVLWR